MDMSIPFAEQLRHKLTRIALVLPFLFLIVAIPRSGGVGSGSSQLLMVAGTPGSQILATYPVRLYTVGVNGKLREIREVISQQVGLNSILSSKVALFAASPSIVPTSLSIIHFEHPQRSDDIVFNPQKWFAFEGGMAISHYDRTFAELVPLSPPKFHSPCDRLAVVSEDTGSTRLASNDWSLYSYLWRDGEIGGPSFSPDLVGSVVGDHLAISLCRHSVFVDTLPSFIISQRRVPIISAANSEYLVLRLQRTLEEQASPKLRTWMQVFVHERNKNRWERLKLEGNSSRSRLFDNWLACTVQNWNPTHKTSPGRASERNFATPQLPNVQTLYSEFVGRFYYSPGTLVLENLHNDRKITIQTGQEDSEILWVGNDQVLYRVNDAIYQAQIVGDKIQNPTLVVKDDDVPEIHWVFWSK